MYKNSLALGVLLNGELWDVGCIVTDVTLFFIVELVSNQITPTL